MDKKPALESKLVEEFVGKSHGDWERVKELLAEEPALVNAYLGRDSTDRKCRSRRRRCKSRAGVSYIA